MIDISTYRAIRQYHLQGKSDRWIARSLKISRDTVARYKNGDHIPDLNYMPKRSRARTVITEDVDQFIIDCFCEDDREGIRKQRHTAQRIFERLREERGFEGGETTVRRRVRELKAEYYPPRADLPLHFSPGEAMQVDFGQVYVYISGERTILHHFTARLCFSCAVYVFAGLHETTETFIEGVRNAFEYFGGVPKRVIFDNGSAAVKSGLGKKAVATDPYKILAAHYNFETVFCNAASGQEKGLVENLVGYSRRAFMTPLPRVESVGELNYELRRKCERYIEGHRVPKRNDSVQVQYSQERKTLQPLPAVRFDTSKVYPAVHVSDESLVAVDSCRYSVPVRYVGRWVTARVSALEVKIIINHDVTIVHDRLRTTNSVSYKLEHYIDEIARKPRAAFQTEPVRRTIPEDVLEICRKLPGGDMDMIKILMMFVNYGSRKVIEAIKEANIIESVSTDVIRSFIETDGSRVTEEIKEPPVTYPEIKVLETDPGKYDRLFGGKNNG